LANYGIVSTSYVLYNSVAFAGKVKSAVLTFGKEVLDISTYQAAAAAGRIKALGLENHTLDLILMLDMSAPGAGATYATVAAAWIAGVAFPVYYRLDIAAAGATNPEFRCNYVQGQFAIGAPFGQYMELTCHLESSGVMTIFTG
jgi:hypothetical protein